ncbi:hypothetical protein ACGFK1_10555 [Mycobacterium sp. NPDC048908]|uniref:hypothetical protein n=1 Tax=Mycobacterium sp. NPDC048908 TaxID=3364292 RepID=UPI003717E57E
MSDGTRLRLEKVLAHNAAGAGERARPLQKLGVVARRALVDEIETKLRSVLNDTIADLVVGGWRSYGAVKRAISTSLHQRGVDHVVQLCTHTITASQQHNLDVAVDGFHVMTLCVELTTRIQLYDVVAIVRDGHVRAVRSGRAAVDGSLTVAKVPVAHRAWTFPFTAELALHSSGGRDGGSQRVCATSLPARMT